MCRMQCYANESCLTPKFSPAYGTILFPGVNGVLKYIHLGWSKSCCISYQKACCICISRPQYQLYSYTNSTINIRKLYRTCYDSATAYDSSAASCRISSQISPMSLITLSSLLVDNINHWMNLYPISLTFHDALGWLYHNPFLLYVIQSYRFAVEQSISCCKLHDSIDKASWAYQL